jgi:hypothetical protein
MRWNSKVSGFDAYWRLKGGGYGIRGLFNEYGSVECMTRLMGWFSTD